MKNKYVLHICHGFFETSLYKLLLNSLKSLGIESVVYVSKYHNILKTFNDNVHTISKHYSLMSKLLYFPRQKYIYKELLKFSNCASFIHVHRIFEGGLVAYKIKNEYKIPYVVTIRNSDVNTYFKWFFYLRLIAVKIMLEADKVIFVSPAYRKTVISKYVPNKYKQKIMGKSLIIPNGIDSYFLQNKVNRSSFVWNRKNINLIYVGEISSNKNIQTTINVCKLLIKMNYEVSFVIVGEIKNPKYEKLIKQNNFITYHLKSSKYEVVQYLRKADIFVMPSIHETFGLVYAEAMSQGMPIIYTKNQGFDGFFIDGFVGFSIEPYDVNGIANKILMIYNAYSDISNRCSQNVDMFNWDIIAKTYCSIYSNHSAVIGSV